ncbi:methionine ABC transporter ATP-binding protein [Herbaspirillum huttiense F1]|jgi:ABC-type metal ion transport system, ATPase component|uniref:methionine ABC transporter ATP-binding protein n=1 Tax=Herbaspirillum TaxID=963 RepID=UPI00195B95F5|nr:MULTISPECIES: methionine ABC transporter ATP-binding protein [Herbaspirillum]MBP1315256.1 D-methionine transport system ATP-binding protein [Herbaspirillum sp. 1130]MDR6741083.1 D-methionine transport system ATP-binding protein [Herbaspirillum sp. 1173]MDT0357484.1 methionine ABC transporter ATP-binding protein [Herbaspirillum huttiense F1]
MIEIQAVTQRFGNVEAVRNVDLSIRKGEIFGIIGRSGAGKSTLVRTLNLLNRPTSGRIVLDGQDLTSLSSSQLREARRGIGMIFQHFNLLSSRSVYDNIALPLELAGKSKSEIAAKVEPLLELVGLTALRDRYPAQISGGQKQRVGIARALANDPKVLLSDEATSALDPETTRSILELLRKINKELGLTIVLITHQMEVIKQICDRVAVMEAGQVIEQGEVLEVFRQPRHEVTRALIGDVIAHELPKGVLARLRERLARADVGQGTDHLFRFAFTGNDVDQPHLSEAVRRFNLNFNILHGQIDEIQGQAFGSLAILANGTQDNINQAMQYLREQGVVVEELNHVI